MTDALFSELELGRTDDRPGFRLARLEVLNWGTFDRNVWTFEVGGSNALLTGDIGSGKSTLVDAVTTLLMPANRISYNKAAGADTRERDLRSYVRGHHKMARDEVHGTSKPVALRDGDTYSVVLGSFVNVALDRQVTLAQVFWLRANQGGQPDRFYLIGEHDLSIAKDFADFGDQVAPLKRRLRDSGASVFDHFPEYGREYRRALGIPSDQAIELFHQTVSMKSVGDLNDFVRSHMLEPWDASSRIAEIVSHFDDLNKAHEAVLRARAQIEILEPMLEAGAEYERHAEQRRDLSQLRGALAAYFGHHRVALLDAERERLSGDIAQFETRLADADTEVADVRARREQLSLQRAQLGGDRIGRIEEELGRLGEQREATRRRADGFNERLADAGLAPVEEAADFAERLREIDVATEEAGRTAHEHKQRHGELVADQRELGKEIDAVKADIASLQQRTSSIPRRSLDLRDRLCADLGLDPDEVPFAGELIAIRDDSLEWEGAAERLLRPFGLSLLVGEQQYAAVARWVNDHHLGSRLVYYRVPDRVRADRELPGPDSLFARLQIRKGRFYGWLEAELARRAEHVCVESIEEFRRERRAVTREGQIKGGGGRHEKDDRHPIDDRSRYVLGWTNRRTIEAVRAKAVELNRRDQEITQAITESDRADTALSARRVAFGVLAETRTYDELDWRRADRQIGELEAEKRSIEESSDELARLTDAMERAGTELSDAEKARDFVNNRLAVARNEHATCETDLEDARAQLSDVDVSAHDALEGDLARRLVSWCPATPNECDRNQRRAYEQLTKEIEKANNEEYNAQRRAEARMKDFRVRYPVDARELDDSIKSLGEFREIHDRIAGDDLPRFEADFKSYLNTNTIRDIASFNAELHKQEELIRERISRINGSLTAIDYAPGRYVRLEHASTPNREIQEFRSDLRNATAGTVAGEQSEQYSEQKFLQVKALVDRFKGRESFTDADRRWTRTVTDVRNWLTFSASERWRETDEEHEHYTDSGGKSGGQKEKLAYTILAASIAYQFRLEWGVAASQNFQFVVIDEAFGRGSDESTRFALGLFQRLGLQLLIVTPLQKIQVIEPYVSTVGLVDNPGGDASRIQVLTIEEYVERRRQRAMAALVEDVAGE